MTTPITRSFSAQFWLWFLNPVTGPAQKLAMDGTTGKGDYRVDGFTLEEHGAVLERLRGYCG